MQRKRAMLTREKICDFAIKLIESDGLENLSMRALAGHLGVEAPSLYKHISSKSDLLDLIQESIVNQLLFNQKISCWQNCLLEVAVSIRKILLKYRNIAPLFATRPALGESALELASKVYEFLSNAGFKPQEVIFAYRILCRFVFGHVLAETGHLSGCHKEKTEKQVFLACKEKFPYIFNASVSKISKDHNQSFNFGLKIIINGLENILPKSHEKKNG